MSQPNLNEDLNIVANSNIEITLLDGDLNIIQALDDEPNDVGGLTSAELKAKFDEGPNKIKTYINGTLIPEILTEEATEASRAAAEAQREANETQRIENENARIAAEQARVDETNGVVAQANQAAQSWAVGGTGTREGEDTNNAKYFCERAKEVAGGDFVLRSEMGAANGVATLGEDALLAAAQRPKAGGLYRDDGTTTVEASLAEISTTLQNKIDASSGAGAHNSIYRGKYLGDSVTAEQYAAINDGTFDNLYIGDYWTIGGVNYRIAAFDYYLTTGDTACNTHHVTLVPDTALYSHVMNDTNTTEGGYIGSKMKTSGLDQAVTTINNAFGSAHILTRRELFTNAVSNGKPSGGSWYDSTVDLMTEQNVYGSRFFAPAPDGTTIPYQYVVDKSQYPLFAFRPDMISNRVNYWLRDVVSAAYFANVRGNGNAYYNSASAASGVRPAFSIKA